MGAPQIIFLQMCIRDRPGTTPHTLTLSGDGTIEAEGDTKGITLPAGSQLVVLSLIHISTKPVFRGLSADVEAGRVYCIVGKSGAGKTSLLSLLAGLDTCTEGTLSLIHI